MANFDKIFKRIYLVFSVINDISYWKVLKSIDLVLKSKILLNLKFTVMDFTFKIPP